MPFHIRLQLPCEFRDHLPEHNYYRQANDANRHYNIKASNHKLVAAFETALENERTRIQLPFLLTLLPTQTLEKHDEIFTTLNEAIFTAMRAAHAVTKSRRGGVPLRVWCPANELLYRYLACLTSIQTIFRDSRRSNHNKVTTAHDRLHSLITRLQHSKNPVTKTKRFKTLIPLHIRTTDPQSNYNQIMQTTELFALQTLIKTERSRIQKLSHAKQATLRINTINKAVAKRSAQIRSGKCKAALDSLLGKIPQRKMEPTVGEDETVYISPLKAYNVTKQHFQRHFTSTNTYIETTGLDNNDAQGTALREHILQGTWTTDPAIRDSLLAPFESAADQEMATRLLHHMRIKANPATQIEMR